VVAQFLQLKLQLLSNTFSRSSHRLLGVVGGVLCVIIVAAAVMISLVGLRSHSDVEETRDVLVVVGSIAILGFFLVPFILGTEDSMDPRKFALLGLPERELASGLVLAGLLSVPAVALTFVLVGTVVTWSLSFLSAVIALLAAGVVLFTGILASRVGMGLAALFLSTRRSRQFATAGGVLLLLVSAPVALLALNIDWAGADPGLLARLSSVLGWTPLGAAWAAPGDAATGFWEEALVKLLLAGTTLVLLWRGWHALVVRMLVSPGRPQVPVRQRAGLGWFELLPNNPIGAIAARSLTYWGRDSRYWVSLVMIPLVPVIAVVPLAIAGVPGHWLALVPVPLMCVFLGWAAHNDVAYDSTAIWLHISSGTRGFADRIGRLIPSLSVGIPLIGLGSVVSVFFFNDWAVLPSMLGVSTCIFLTGLGVSSYSSARYPYAVTKPGDSPFSQPQASESSSAYTQTLTFLGPIVVALPVIALAFLGLSVGFVWHLVALIVGAVLGLVAAIFGVWSGGRAFERRGPDLLTSAQRS